MTNKNRMRYDPLYRVIDETENMRIIEGNYSTFFERLKRITNLGIIPEIIEMANHSKYEHYVGTMYQIENLIKYGNITEEYRAPLEISGIFLHLGHLPLTLSTERSLLLASNLDEKVKKFVEKKIIKVLKIVDFPKDVQIKRLDNLFSLKNYKILYKYFSAEIFRSNWGKIQNLCDLEDEQKRVIIKNLIDHENVGYEYIKFADTVDYVQRDALYFGSVKIDVSPRYLYKNLDASNMYSIDEKKLIYSNRDYLKERFYQNQDIRWFTRLYEKILAMLLMNKKFNKEWLFDFDDDQLRKLIYEDFKENKSIGLPYKWINRMQKLLDHKTNFSLVFDLSDLPFKVNTAINLEYKILAKGKSKTGLLNYPFENGLLLDIDYSQSKARPGFNSFSIGLYQDDSKIELIKILKVIQRLIYSCSFENIDYIEEGLCKQFSWNNVRFNNEPVFNALEECLDKFENNLKKENGDENKSIIKDLLKELKGKELFRKIQENIENYRMLSLMEFFLEETNEKRDTHKYANQIFLSLLFSFTEFIKYKNVKEFIEDLYNFILQEIPNISEDKRGHFFEALWILERFQDKKDFKILINGMIVSNPYKTKDKTDVNEFDVIEVYIEDDKAKCDIYACSIADDYEKNEDQLRKLAKNIYEKYSDITIKAYYVVPSNRNWNDYKPVTKPTGISWP
ncbi:MAG: hypothetical protein HVN34_06450 [Methanobacteriaceae archaeon]|nr:hypothetical protein [Methanobacteriaceae archaeon]